MDFTIINYIIWDVDPDIFTIPWINRPIRWYGLFWLLGLIMSYQFLNNIFKSEGKSIDLLDKLSWSIILGTLIGARLGHVLFYNPSYYFLQRPLEIFAVWEGGLASHGGAIGILVAMIIFSKRNHINFWWLADRIAIVIPLASGLIRLGNLFNSEMIGSATSVPWAFIFTKYDYVPRHPAQLYEAISYFLVFIVLVCLSRTDVIRRKGNLFAMMLISMFSLRFVLEIFKLNQELFEDNMFLNMGQILSLPFLLGGIIILILNPKKQ
ncbi:prolipoprotein diacylglyceryl transferase [Sphingobacterium sp. lm-10]|uniref:prolipoprotein diacylglyceryl transferase n=1 Tax=Sphingobacterium sp. lm-10 TaxID=2944904 RepID=UPI00201FD8C7|nr:prolipoprotein diacylglyceryl transferase [Sphingobacterium sp. lm-10]MCL7989228.1 prolipoprotein diacylglyceryl transferase [Sphingobacterium sp. lm-10]